MRHKQQRAGIWSVVPPIHDFQHAHAGYCPADDYMGKGQFRRKHWSAQRSAERAKEVLASERECPVIRLDCMSLPLPHAVTYAYTGDS